jgi:hypothetical protein
MTQSVDNQLRDRLAEFRSDFQRLRSDLSSNCQSALDQDQAKIEVSRSSRQRSGVACCKLS